MHTQYDTKTPNTYIKTSGDTAAATSALRTPRRVVFSLLCHRQHRPTHSRASATLRHEMSPGQGCFTLLHVRDSGEILCNKLPGQNRNTTIRQDEKHNEQGRRLCHVSICLLLLRYLHFGRSSPLTRHNPPSTQKMSSQFPIISLR